MNEQLFLVLGACAVFLLIGFLIGRWYTLQRFLNNQRTLETAVSDLEVRVTELNNQLNEDPIRAALNHGQRIVINQMEVLLKTMREAIK